MTETNNFPLKPAAPPPLAANRPPAESEELFGLAFQTHPDAISLNRAGDGLFLEINDGFTQLTGYTQTEVSGKTSLELDIWVNPTDWERLVKVLLADGRVENFEAQFHRKNGQVGLGVITARLLRRNQEEVILSIIQDITARKQMEQELKRWVDIFQNVAFGFVVGSPEDRQLGIMNPAFARMHGYTMDELIGTPIANVFAPESRAELPEQIRRVHEQGRHTWESRHVRKDGTIFPVIVDAVAVKTDEGQILYRIVTVQDISERKRSDAQRDRLTERLNLAARAAKIGIWDWDIQKNELVWDDQMYALYGLQPGEFGGAYEAWLHGVHPDDREASNEVSARAQRGEIEYDTEFRVLWPDGSVHWLNATGQVFCDEKGAPLRMVGVNYDITERKQLEESLHESEQKYTLLFEKSTVPTAVLKLPDVVITDANEACERLTGFTRQEMFGKTSTELGLARTEERMEVISRFERQGALADNEIRLFTKSGEERVVVSNTTPVKIGGQMYAITTMQDITARKVVEQQLQENERKYRELVQNANSAIIRWQSDGTITFFNEYAQSFFGYRPEEILGQPVSILVPETDSTGGDLSTLVQNIVDHPEQFVNVVNENICRDGRRAWLAWTNKPVYAENGQLIEILAVGSDITERKHVEDELRRSNAELEQFAYVSSHDLQEPLRTVAGMVQLLQQRYEGQLDERADEYIGFAVDAANRMQQLINDLLDFSRVERQGQTFTATAMEQILQTALANLQTAIAASGAQITSDPLPVVQADAGQLILVWQNLLSNAIKFRSENPPEIHIGSVKIENSWQFAVQDNGIGIDPQYFERVFLLFQRLHTRRKYPGSGIGLALCKKIIERHGGKMWIQSELNHGATLFFTLPERS